MTDYVKCEADILEDRPLSGEVLCVEINMNNRKRIERHDLVFKVSWSFIDVTARNNNFKDLQKLERKPLRFCKCV